MALGGHARSGPAPSPTSGRSDRKGLTFDALPAGGHKGPVPKFPLPGITARERALWRWAWGTPQAEAWSRASWRWYSVAMWVRTAVVCEGADAKAADKAMLRSLGDDIGLSPSGLRFNGWTIAKAVEGSPADAATAPVPSARDRFEVIDGGA